MPVEEEPRPADVDNSGADAGTEPGAAPPDEGRRELRFAYVPGVMPGKWIRRWEERMPDIPLRSFVADGAAQLSVLRDGSADLSFVRLPVEQEELHVIPLYEEQPAVVAPKGHEITVFEDVELADLAEENFLDIAEMGGPEMALQVVASGAGLVIMPMPMARHFNVKDTVARRLHGAEPTRIALAWPKDATDEVIEEFIGVVRGRTANSSRQPSAKQEKPKRAPKSDRRGKASGSGAGGAKKVAQRYAPNPDKGRGRGSRKKGKR
ncbi:LysR family transcriptional regulator substrate-binding protein [Arthrobacter sp. SW1]|uniref:LysR family transcriptional regulator substrate-binding protein n=1 Tax=Arthrobacter sp. SW1 TaxID=1920889 RepID=UPI0009459F3E|nr:LysR family transcriptional regulator substrate-binding protein [Arthrobacter sp. SW1]